MQAPSPFSAHEPKLQRAWDSTSLRAMMFCPRFYEYTILEGWRGSTLDLEFGVLAHVGFETWLKARLAGRTKEEATLDAVRVVVAQSGTRGEDNGSLWSPWGGSYYDSWRCTGANPYRNAKGNKAKCPWSFKGKWHITPAPSVCGECGSDIETANRWVPRDTAKDRIGLIRMLVWWCEEQPDDFGEGLDPFGFSDGTPAVELSFKIPLPYKTPDGGPYILCGHLDGIFQLGDELFVGDHKTSSKTLGKGYYAGFSPSIQMDTYDLAAYLLYQDLDIKGIVIDAVQLLVGGARFGRGVLYRNQAQREEYLKELEYWLRLAEKYAGDNFWPMNRANCWICGFKNICSKDPDKRQQFLEADYQKKPWNPLEER